MTRANAEPARPGGGEPSGSTSAPAEVSSAILTLPNAVTAVRLAGIPVCALLLLRGDYAAGAALTAVVAGTDWLDGWLARRYGQVSRVGQLLDPLADRLLIAVVALALAIQGVISWPVLILLAGRDLLLLGGFAVLARRGVRPPDVIWFGKAVTFYLLVIVTGLILSQTGIPLAWLLQDLAPFAVGLGVALYYAVGITYVVLALRQVRTTTTCAQQRPSP